MVWMNVHPARVFEDLVISEDRHLVSDLESRAGGSAPTDVEYRIRRADTGALRWIARKGSIQRDESGKPVSFAGVARDVTDQRAARDALARSEERFKTIVETIEAAFAVVEVKFDADDRPIDYRFLEANPAFERQSGVDLRGKWVTEYAPDLEQFWFDTYGHVAKSGEPATFESYAEAFKRWFDVRAVRVGDPADRQIAIFFSDSTPRKDAERRLVELKDTLEQEVQARTTELNRLWQTSPDLLLLIDFEGYFRRVNPAWTSMLGYEPDELIGHHVNEFVLTDDHSETVDAYTLAAEGGMPRIVNRYRHKDGSVRWISWVAAQGEDVTYATGRDVTAERQQAAELAQAHEQLRQAQKMEAVGQLTGGIAHDFNNMLTGVIGSLDLIQRHIKTGRMETVDRYVDAANTSAQRAAALTARLLAFGRRQSLDLKPIDVNGLVSGMEDLLRRTLGEQVALETHFATNLWAGHTDAHQLESALLNLCINARDAMPDGGKLTVETANTHLDERYAREHTDVSPGDYVVICVSDTGIGMAPSTVEKVFEPFFTTKPVGQGTGLGLSMIYGFARQAGGHVRIYSELGQGTTIKLYVPRFEGEVEVAAGEGRQAPDGDGETVLLVEDDPSVRMIVLEVLEELGYVSIEASDGRAAIPILQSDRKIDLLISDVGLPGLNGRQIAEIAREHRPELRVLFITGYAQNAAVRGGFLDRGMEMMTKPFAVDALATKIRQMLQGRN
ncbi:PAS domain S-box protein [Sphingomonas sp. Ag1]|jgi:PAS domain S-box-containing protein|uniref:PAS domain S-box protein n=1 Tax=Sphingomonas sp. Ag1 TaxID=1642949 RepID=UPI0018CEA5A2|nr:PAS domain S-box protein [Sphingomonas sp. Ag1]